MNNVHIHFIIENTGVLKPVSLNDLDASSILPQSWTPDAKMAPKLWSDNANYINQLKCQKTLDKVGFMLNYLGLVGQSELAINASEELL